MWFLNSLFILRGNVRFPASATSSREIEVKRQKHMKVYISSNQQDGQ